MLSRQAGIACTVREQANAESIELWPLVKFLINVFVWSVAPANVVLCCLILASHIGTYKCRSWRTKQYFYFMSCPLNQQPPWHSAAPGESKARQDWHWLEQCENVDEPVLRGGIRVTHGTKKHQQLCMTVDLGPKIGFPLANSSDVENFMVLVWHSWDQHASKNYTPSRLQLCRSPWKRACGWKSGVPRCSQRELKKGWTLQQPNIFQHKYGWKMLENVGSRAMPRKGHISELVAVSAGPDKASGVQKVAEMPPGWGSKCCRCPDLDHGDIRWYIMMIYIIDSTFQPLVTCSSCQVYVYFKKFPKQAGVGRL